MVGDRLVFLDAGRVGFGEVIILRGEGGQGLGGDIGQLG